MQLFVVKLDEQ